MQGVVRIRTTSLAVLASRPHVLAHAHCLVLLLPFVVRRWIKMMIETLRAQPNDDADNHVMALVSRNLIDYHIIYLSRSLLFMSPVLCFVF
jgi:hypothetical protein